MDYREKIRQAINEPAEEQPPNEQPLDPVREAMPLDPVKKAFEKFTISTETAKKAFERLGIETRRAVWETNCDVDELLEILNGIDIDKYL